MLKSVGGFGAFLQYMTLNRTWPTLCNPDQRRAGQVLPPARGRQQNMDVAACDRHSTTDLLTPRRLLLPYGVADALLSTRSSTLFTVLVSP